jgi:hypothetical protein
VRLDVIADVESVPAVAKVVKYFVGVQELDDGLRRIGYTDDTR